MKISNSFSNLNEITNNLNNFSIHKFVHEKNLNKLKNKKHQNDNYNNNKENFKNDDSYHHIILTENYSNKLKNSNQRFFSSTPIKNINFNNNINNIENNYNNFDNNQSLKEEKNQNDIDYMNMKKGFEYLKNQIEDLNKYVNNKNNYKSKSNFKYFNNNNNIFTRNKKSIFNLSNDEDFYYKNNLLSYQNETPFFYNNNLQV